MSTDWNQKAPSKPNFAPTARANTGPRIIDVVMANALMAMALISCSFGTIADMSADRTLSVKMVVAAW